MLFLILVLSLVCFTHATFCSLEVLKPHNINSWGSPDALYLKIKDDLFNKTFDLAKANIDAIRTTHNQMPIGVSLDKVFQDVRKMNPIFHLYECIDCPISRSENFSRADYELTVIKTGIELYRAKKRALNYVSFASGGLLQDLLILCQMLENGVTEINFHSIDIEKEPYISILHGQKQIRAFDALPAYDIKEMAFSHPIAMRYAARFDTNLYHQHEMVSQFVHWIFYNYPKATVRFFFHAHVNEYMRYCEQNDDMIADLIGACDIADFKPFNTEFERKAVLEPYGVANAHLQELIRFCLSHNSKLESYFLDIDGTLYHNHIKDVVPVTKKCSVMKTLMRSPIGKAALGLLLLTGCLTIKKLKAMFYY